MSRTSLRPAVRPNLGKVVQLTFMACAGREQTPWVGKAVWQRF